MRLFLVCVAAVLISLPFWINLPIDATRLSAYASAGAWLQGALTPLLLGVAIISFWTQRKSADDQAKAQPDASHIAAWTLFIDNMDKFAGHLSYRCLCAIYGQQLPGHCNPPDERIGLNAMPAMFKGFDPVTAGIIPSVSDHDVLTLEAMRLTEQYATLAREVDQVLALSKRVHLEGMLDSRIRDIRNLIERYPPMSPVNLKGRNT